MNILRKAHTLPVALVLAIAFDLSNIPALCTSPAMEGKWLNVATDGVLKTISLDFKCCDQTFCPVGQPCVTVCTPPTDIVRVTGPCQRGTCDWGDAVPHYMFMNAADGNQYTRVDVQYKDNSEVRELVLLLLGSDQMIVHWSTSYADGNSARDFSLIEYFEHQHCFTLSSGLEVCWDPSHHLLPIDPTPRVIRQ